MIAEDLNDPTIENENNYDDLVLAIETSDRQLSLLLAVCDDSNFRDRLIECYETEVQLLQIRPYRLTLEPKEPSLRAAVAKLVQGCSLSGIEGDEYLRSGGRAVLTVTGIEKLFFLKLGAERSQQEIFFGYLQWTREGLREFPYPIVLWMTNQVLIELSKKAIDFWSWRKGVFRFVSKKTAAIPSEEILPLLTLEDRASFIADDPERSRRVNDDSYLLPLEDLQQMIQQIEQRGNRNASLATLYAGVGDVYKSRLDRSEFQDYQQEQARAIEYFHKAAELQKELNLEIDLATSLNNLARLYESQGRYAEAEPLYLQALELRQRLLGEEHPDVATSLNNLAGLYYSQGRYDAEAEPLCRQALELRQRLLGEEHPDVATSLNNLALLYYSQGRYAEAEPLLQQALEMSQRLLGEEHPDVATSLNNLAGLYRLQGRYFEAEPLLQKALELRQRLLGEEHPDVATSLNNLAGLYESQGRYAEAEPLYLQDLALSQRLLGEEHPAVATSLNNLAGLYYSQGRYAEAEPLFQQALEMSQRLRGEEHPDVATNLNNLANLYKSQGRYAEAESLFQQALEMSQRLLGEEHPDVATSLNNLANLYNSQGRYAEAEPLYLQALELCQRLLGAEHPNTVTVRENLESLRTKMQSAPLS